MAQFNPNSKHPARALQAWIILVGAARNRQTLTYEGLSVLMFQRKAAGVLDKILGHIAFYCIEQDLPALTSIVVGKGRGTPGLDIPIDATTMNSSREKVYTYDWYDEYPPTEAELAAAMKAGMAPAPVVAVPAKRAAYTVEARAIVRRAWGASSCRQGSRRSPGTAVRHSLRA